MKHGSLPLVVPFLLLVILLSIAGCTFLFGPPDLQTNPCTMESARIPAPGINESLAEANEASVVDANDNCSGTCTSLAAADP